MESKEELSKQEKPKTLENQKDQKETPKEIKEIIENLKRGFIHDSGFFAEYGADDECDPFVVALDSNGIFVRLLIPDDFHLDDHDRGVLQSAMRVAESFTKNLRPGSSKFVQVERKLVRLYTSLHDKELSRYLIHVVKNEFKYMTYDIIVSFLGH